MAPATKGTQTVLGGLSGIGSGLLKVTVHGAACVDADERTGIRAAKKRAKPGSLVIYEVVWLSWTAPIVNV